MCLDREAMGPRCQPPHAGKQRTRANNARGQTTSVGGLLLLDEHQSTHRCCLAFRVLVPKVPRRAKPLAKLSQYRRANKAHSSAATEGDACGRTGMSAAN